MKKFSFKPNAKKISEPSNSASEGSSLMKFLYDYLPLIVFFACYKLSRAPNPLITATTYMIITTSIALIIAYALTKRIPMVALVSSIVLGIFGGLTVLLQDDIFIKTKPTIVNLIFAAILFYGFFRKKPFLSYILGEKIKMNNEAWLTLSMRWGLFFIFLAILNEVIWRNFSTDFWVQFKVFGMMTISIIFTVAQVPFMMKEMKKIENSKA
jgi:intracellular septation protein